MPSISLANLTDFVAATGTARITKVRNAKRLYEQVYNPQWDYWKPLRDRIEACFKAGWNAKALKEALADVTDPKKQANYEACRAGLTNWVGRRTVTYQTPLRDTWSSGGLDVSIDPELCLDIGGQAHLVKLYFRADPLSKQRADLILHLLSKFAASTDTVGVLDVRRSKLFVPTVEISALDATLDAEAIALANLWPAV